MDNTGKSTSSAALSASPIAVHSPLEIPQLKKILNDCFQPDPKIYWADFLGSCVLGYGSLVLTEMVPTFSALWFLGFVVSVFALYRAVLFTHELTHQDRKKLPGFSVAYNLLVGVPFLVPSFMYRGVHTDHHKKNSYATQEDGEYIAFGASPFWKTIAYICQSFYLPIVLAIRFGIIGPLSLLHPKLRLLVMKKASSMAIRFDADRKVPVGIDLRNWYALEVLCFLYVAGMTYVFASGILSLATLAHVYAVVVCAFIINSTRTVVAHRYRNKEFKELSFHDQLLDSVNLEGNPIIGELVAPVGLRFHGLHHLFAAMPYHNLAKAHRRLREQLPKDSMYHLTVEPNLLSAFRTHYR
ncbi:MAG: fatty acid desaturase, partial [Proteobacteria bacterium]